MFESKELSLTNFDISEWTHDDVIDIAEDISEMLSIRNYLKHYIHGLVKNSWNTAKDSLK